MLSNRRSFFRRLPQHAAEALREADTRPRHSLRSLFEMPAERLAEIIPCFTARRFSLHDGTELVIEGEPDSETERILLDAVERRLLPHFGSGRSLRAICETAAAELGEPTELLTARAIRLFLALARHWVCVPAHRL